MIMKRAEVISINDISPAYTIQRIAALCNSSAEDEGRISHESTEIAEELFTWNPPDSTAEEIEVQ